MITFPSLSHQVGGRKQPDKRGNHHHAIMSAPLPTDTTTSDPPPPSPPAPLPPPLPPASDVPTRRLPGHRRCLFIRLAAAGGLHGRHVRGREDRVELEADRLLGPCRRPSRRHLGRAHRLRAPRRLHPRPRRQPPARESRRICAPLPGFSRVSLGFGGFQGGGGVSDVFVSACRWGSRAWDWGSSSVPKGCWSATRATLRFFPIAGNVILSSKWWRATFEFLMGSGPSCRSDFYFYYYYFKIKKQHF